MANLLGKTLERHPKLPVLLANTVVGKIIHLIEGKVVDPIFDHEKTIQAFQSWSNPAKKTAEWVFYLLSGVVRTIPDQQNPLRIVMQESLAETLTQVGIKITEMPKIEQIEAMNIALPAVRQELVKTIKENHKFRDALSSIFGTPQVWNSAIEATSRYLSQKREEVEAHRQARQARGWRRFFI